MSAGYSHFIAAGFRELDSRFEDAKLSLALASKRAGHCQTLALAVSAGWPGQTVCKWLPASARPAGYGGRVEYPAEQSANGILRAEESAASRAAVAAERARIAAEVAAMPRLETRSVRRWRERAERYGEVQLPSAPPPNTPFAALLANKQEK